MAAPDCARTGPPPLTLQGSKCWCLLSNGAGDAVLSWQAEEGADCSLPLADRGMQMRFAGAVVGEQGKEQAKAREKGRQGGVDTRGSLHARTCSRPTLLFSFPHHTRLDGCATASRTGAAVVRPRPVPLRPVDTMLAALCLPACGNAVDGAEHARVVPADLQQHRRLSSMEGGYSSQGQDSGARAHDGSAA